MENRSYSEDRFGLARIGQAAKASPMTDLLAS
jgi:hypothetical protein